MKKPSREEYTERGAALGVDETYKYVEALEGYCEQLEKAYEDVKKGLDNVYGTSYAKIKNKKYWKKELMEDD